MENVDELVQYIIDNMMYLSSYTVIENNRSIGWFTTRNAEDGWGVYNILLISDEILVELSFLRDSSRIKIYHYHRNVFPYHYEIPVQQKITIPEMHKLLMIYVEASLEQVTIPSEEIDTGSIRKLHNKYFHKN